MQPSEFKAWRKSLALTQKQAAELLGLNSRIIQYYEKGVRNGKQLEIPKAIELACYTLNLGIKSYSGPDLIETKSST